MKKYISDGGARLLTMSKRDLKFHKDMLPVYLKAVIIACSCAYIYYNSPFGLIAGSLAGFYTYRILKKQVIKKRERSLLEQFKDMIIAMQSALEAGKSMEQSIISAGRELRQSYGEKLEIVHQIDIIEKKLRLSITLEEALSDFADKLAIREAASFVDVIKTMRRTGGNALQVITDTVQKIVDVIELEEELAVVVAAKQMELMTMVFMPAFVVIFLRVSSKGFIDPLYGNLTGVIIMTILLAANIGADYLGRRIVDISVS